jgi:hypothetical protein
MSLAIHEAEKVIDRINERLKWLPEDEKYPVELSKKEAVCLKNLLDEAKSQEDIGIKLERELQIALKKLERIEG